MIASICLPPRSITCATYQRYVCDTNQSPASPSASTKTLSSFLWIHIVKSNQRLNIYTCEGGERKPARVVSVKPARKMISNIDYPIISHLSNMPTFFWAKTRQIRGADTPRGRNVPSRPKADQMAHGVVCHFDLPHMAQKVADWTRREGRPRADEMAHGAVCRFELPHVAENNRRVTRHMAQKVADWTRREGRPRADEMAHGAVGRFELPHVAENNRRPPHPLLILTSFARWNYA